MLNTWVSLPNVEHINIVPNWDRFKDKLKMICDLLFRSSFLFSSFYVYFFAALCKYYIAQCHERVCVDVVDSILHWCLTKAHVGTNVADKRVQKCYNG